MSGYLTRLVVRAQGGAALASVPLVRPMPSIYGTAAPRDDIVADAAHGFSPDTEAPADERQARRAAADPPQPARGRELPDALSAAPRSVPAEDSPEPAIGQGAPAHSAEKPVPAIAAPRAADSAASALMPSEPRLRRDPLARLFDAIEAAEAPPPARRTETRPNWNTPAVPTPGAPGGETPLVSIGRITISVAPPPPPIQTAPARSQGFQNYARLRRGLER